MLAFIHIHKAAGTTIHHVLRSTFGSAHCDLEPWDAPTPPLEQWQVPVSANDLYKLKKIYPNLKSIAGHSVHPYSDLELECTAIRYFTFMREPVSMGASLYQYVIENRGKSWSFEEWMQKESTQNRQTKMIAGSKDVNKAIEIIEEKNIFIGLSEQFDESMILLQSQLAPELNLAYVRKNVASTNSLAKEILLDDCKRQMLVDANQADIELHNYIKTEVYPRQQSLYGEQQLQEAVSNYQVDAGQFNFRNARLSYGKLHMIYRPLRFLNRQGIKIVR